MTATNLPAERKPLTLRDRLNQMTPEFKKALPGHIPPEKFVRTVQTAVQMNPAVSKICATPEGVQSLMAACTKAATDGLILDGREAALVPYGQTLQYQPMVAGLMKLARNSGDVIWKTPQIVHENDEFSYDPSRDEVPNHKPDWFGDRGKPVGVYIVCIVNGEKRDEPVVEIMRKEQIMAIAKQSKNAAQYNCDTAANWGEWWRKTVIRRVSKYLPRSSDRDEFMQAVERIDEGFDYDASEPAATAHPVKKRGAGAAALKDITPTTDAHQQPQPEPQNHEPEPIDHDQETGEVYDTQAQHPGDDI